MTSGLTTATMLKENPNLTVIIIGGIVRSGSNSIEGLIGHELLKKVNVDILFTSAYALNASDGLTDFSYMKSNSNAKWLPPPEKQSHLWIIAKSIKVPSPHLQRSKTSNY